MIRFSWEVDDFEGPAECLLFQSEQAGVGDLVKQPVTKHLGQWFVVGGDNQIAASKCEKFRLLRLQVIASASPSIGA